MKIISGALASTLVLAALLSSCAETDVVGQVGVTSFDAATKALGEGISWNEEDQAYVLASPGGDRLAIAKDFSRDNGMGGMGGAATMESPDLEIEFAAAPFLAAGLDVAKLPQSDRVQYILEEGTFMLHFDWGKTPFPKTATPAASVQSQLVQTFEQIVATYRDRVGYHEKLDHYGLALGDGNMVEWAKDLATNDKDLVFVLNPQPLIQAGLDPAKVTGWVFAPVEIKGADGKTSLVDKLLRPFNLK